MTALGMGTGATTMLAAGAIAVVAALAAYAALLARNLVGAKGMPVVVAHGWAALASLVVVIATALALAGAYVGVPTIDRATAIALHVAFAGYGFMGMLALGLSYIVVPMFALSAPPAERPAWASFALAALALLLAGDRGAGHRAAGLLRTVRDRRGTCRGGRASAADGHRAADRNAAAISAARSRSSGWRGRSLVGEPRPSRWRSSLDAPVDGIATQFGLALIGGWLLTFLLAHPAADRAVPRVDARGPGAVRAAGACRRPLRR